MLLEKQKECQEQLEKDTHISDDDEVGKIIEREQIEHAKAEKELAERKALEAEQEKERKLKEEKEAKKLEEVR